MAEKPCGKHVELGSNEAVRVTRCPCGTVHVHVNVSGVTLRLSDDNLQRLAEVIASASAAVSAMDRAPAVRGTGTTTIN